MEGRWDVDCLRSCRSGGYSNDAQNVGPCRYIAIGLGATDSISERPNFLPRREGVKVFLAASATFFARAEKDRGGSARTGRRVLTQRGA
jgi:hypothetical protein